MSLSIDGTAIPTSATISFDGTSLGQINFDNTVVWKKDYTLTGSYGMTHSYTIKNDGGGSHTKSGSSNQQFNLGGIHRIRIYVSYYKVAYGGATIERVIGSFTINGKTASFNAPDGSTSTYVDITHDGSNINAYISYSSTVSANYNYEAPQINLKCDVSRIEFYGG